MALHRLAQRWGGGGANGYVVLGPEGPQNWVLITLLCGGPIQMALLGLVNAVSCPGVELSV